MYQIIRKSYDFDSQTQGQYDYDTIATLHTIEEAEGVLVNFRASINRLAHITYILSNGDESAGNIRDKILNTANELFGPGKVDPNRLNEAEIQAFFKEITPDLCKTINQAGGTVKGSDFIKIVDELNIEYKDEQDRLWSAPVLMSTDFELKEIAVRRYYHPVGDNYCKALQWAGEEFGLRCPTAGEYKIGKSWEETH